MAAAAPSDIALKRTPLYDLHVSLGAKMVPFAGYEMPVQYPLGVMKEHLWTREKAGLFDVSHMGQAWLIADDGRHETVARALETLVPADIVSLKPGQQRYSQLLAEDGGILDDLMITRIDTDGTLYLVVNAGCKHADYAHLIARLPENIRLETMPNQGLLALQGPMAHQVLENFIANAPRLAFMTSQKSTFGRAVYPADVGGFLQPGQSLGDGLNHPEIMISRSGYTGEDGYEISVRASDLESVARKLLADPRVHPIGLGARDSLRLEAGLCLYGHDIDTTTSPIEAGLAWSIQKRRRVEGGFPGATRIQAELVTGPKRMRVGIRPDGRAPARDGTPVVTIAGEPLGTITSGGFGPSVNGPIAMGYVQHGAHVPGTRVNLLVRGQALPAEIVALPFTQHRYFKPKT